MYKKILNFSFFLASVALSLVSCSKDDNSSLSNSTNGKTAAIFNSNITYGSLTDQDGNEYKTVTIGTQTWMAENLRTTKYNDGTPIPKVTDLAIWSGLITGAYCNYNNTASIDTIATYGRLYNWYAVNTGKLAPKGWHVPTDAEWTTLTNYLGSEDIAGGKLKETGTTHWYSPNLGATNATGFTALPGGSRSGDGLFDVIGDYGFYWSSTEYDSDDAYYRALTHLISDVGSDYYVKELGFSVRCIKD
jgi:uncharacterized protein (TIGR02145 family)